MRQDNILIRIVKSVHFPYTVAIVMCIVLIFFMGEAMDRYVIEVNEYWEDQLDRCECFACQPQVYEEEFEWWNDITLQNKSTQYTTSQDTT